ncbi:MAG: preprotein translocase subunit YajC [Calditrichales bacterium]|nr:MAG: preprotein translocase subunit YajC [Calditrichales bacterium]
MLLNIFLMAPQGAEGGSSLLGFLPFVLIIVIMYFLMIRPQVKKQKEKQKLVDSLEKGDKIVTSGGIHGKISGFTDDGKTVILQVDEKVKINVDRSAVNLVKGKTQA